MEELKSEPFRLVLRHRHDTRQSVNEVKDLL
jgi:hypothetical protein